MSAIPPNLKRIAPIVLAVLLVLGVGSANAEFEPAPVSGSSITEPIPTASTTPTPEQTIIDGGVTPVGGGGGNVNNEVVVINTVDGRSAHRARVGAARVTGSEAENQNAAAATSSCSDCRTVAVAAQAVLIQRTDATKIAPRNYAIALNQSCSGCETFAAAYQYVFTTDGLVRFSAGAEQKLAAFEGRIRDVAADESLSFPEMESKLDALVEQMWALVRSELEAAGTTGTGRHSKDSDEATDSTDPSPTPTPSESPSPTPSSEAQASVPDASPSATPTEEPSSAQGPTPSVSTASP